MGEVAKACGRAFARWCDSERRGLDLLFSRIAGELRHVAPADVVSLAIVARTREERAFMGESGPSAALPVDTLLGLIIQLKQDRVRVWDHAIDTVRFVDARFRASVVANVWMTPASIALNSMALWFGTRMAPSQESLSRIVALVEEVGEWFGTYAPAIDGVARGDRERDEAREEASMLRGILHDARAPLGLLKYSISNRESIGESELLGQEVKYLEQLLSQAAPMQSAPSNEVADVRRILNRVRRRFQNLGASAPEIVMSVEYGVTSAKMREVDLERVVSNIVGNAVRHAPKAKISVEALRSSEVVTIRVRDDGPGIPLSILEKISQGERVSESSLGWGVGLLGSKVLLESVGGSLEIRDLTGRGTEVVLSIPRELGSPPPEETLVIAERNVAEIECPESPFVCIVDDDVAHAESLGRILSARGVTARVFSSLAEASSLLTPSSIVLCDVHMPDGGAERLLSMFAGRREIPTIGAMSGDVSEALAYKLAASGARGFFAKPVALDEILDWIELARVRSERCVGARGF